VPDAITSELVTCNRSALIAEIDALRQRTTLLAAVVGLLVAMLRTSKTRGEGTRIPPRSPNPNPICERFLASARRRFSAGSATTT